MIVSDTYQSSVDWRWYIDVDVHSEAGKFEFAITPKQAVRIAADLLAAWREHETMMKNPGPRRNEQI